jgi:hypothetical protein
MQIASVFSHIMFNHPWLPQLFRIFSYFCRKCHDFGRRMYVTGNMWFVFLLLFYAKLSHVMKDSARYHKRTWVLHAKFPLFLSGFNEALIFSTDLDGCPL